MQAADAAGPALCLVAPVRTTPTSNRPRAVQALACEVSEAVWRVSLRMAAACGAAGGAPAYSRYACEGI